MSDVIRSARIVRLRSLPSPRRCFCPINSVKFRGRILAASGMNSNFVGEIFLRDDLDSENNSFILPVTSGERREMALQISWIAEYWFLRNHSDG